MTRRRHTTRRRNPRICCHHHHLVSPVLRLRMLVDGGFVPGFRSNFVPDCPFGIPGSADLFADGNLPSLDQQEEGAKACGRARLSGNAVSLARMKRRRAEESEQTKRNRQWTERAQTAFD